MARTLRPFRCLSTLGEAMSSNDAIDARPPSTTYLFRTFARRNRAVLTTVALVSRRGTTNKPNNAYSRRADKLPRPPEAVAARFTLVQEARDSFVRAGLSTKVAKTDATSLLFFDALPNLEMERKGSMEMQTSARCRIDV